MADDQKPEEIGVICRPSLTMSEKVVMSLRPLAMQQLIKEFLSYMGKVTVDHTRSGSTPSFHNH